MILCQVRLTPQGCCSPSLSCPHWEVGILYPLLEGDSEGCHLPPLNWTPAALGLSGEAPVPRDGQQCLASTRPPFLIPGVRAPRTMCAESEPHSGLFCESMSSNSLSPRTRHAASRPCRGYPTIPAWGQLTPLEIYPVLSQSFIYSAPWQTVIELLHVGEQMEGQ